MIDRFSKDIDITFDEKLGEARSKKVKYQLLQPISELLELPIDNWNSIESDKDYNHYDFSYESVSSEDRSGLRPYVKLDLNCQSALEINLGKVYEVFVLLNQLFELLELLVGEEKVILSKRIKKRELDL